MKFFNEFRRQCIQAGHEKVLPTALSPATVEYAGDGRLALCHAHTRLLLTAIPSALFGLGMLSMPTAFAADQVSAVLPVNGARAAALDTNVEATLTGAETSGLSSQTFVVHTSQSARTGANTTSGSGTTNIAVDLFNDLHPGERVRATVTDDITTAMGPIEPRVWQFRAEATTGSGEFTRSANSLGTFKGWEVALGDLDADGDLDAWVVNYQGQPNRVWLNDGNGVFSDTGQTLGASDSFANDVVLGDLDGDGNLDALVISGGYANKGANLVWINDGSADFSSTGQTLGFDYGYAAALGDVDGDGDLDVWIAVYDAPNRVWLNDGSGGFSDTGSALSNNYSTGVELGDLDGDGDLDAWVANYAQPNRVWRNVGGVFQDTGQELGFYFSNDVALGDVNGDGHLDAWVANFDESNRVWLNDGSGVFSDSGQGLGGTGDSYRVQLGDVDGDGDLDAWVTNFNRSSRLWLNDGSGLFSDSSKTLGGSTSSVGVALGDVDGDGDLDAFVVNYYEADRVWLNTQDMGDAPFPLPTLISQNGARHGNNGTGPRMGGKVDNEMDGQPTVNADGDDTDRLPIDDDEDGIDHVMIQSGALYAEVTVKVTNPPGQLDAWMDFNADGSFDGASEQIFTNRTLTVAGENSLTFAVPADAITGDAFARFRLSSAGGLAPRGAAVGGEVEDHKLELTKPAGFGNFIEVGTLGFGNGTSLAVAVGDLDGDEDLDAFVANASPNRVWINDGSAVFSQSSANSLGNEITQGVALGDLDRDGDLDAFAANIGGNRMWINDGNGVFSVGGPALGGYDSQGVALGDLDGDGDLDAFVANDGINRVQVNDGSGSFSDSGNGIGSSSSRGVALGDLDGDGDLDAFVANDGINRVWLNDGSAIFSLSGNALGSADSWGAALADLDGDGDLDAFVANNGIDRVWENDGSGVFTGSGNSLGDSNGRGVALGDLNNDGELDAFVVNLSQGNRVWKNDSGTFIDTLNSLGGSASRGAALGDFDNDGDLDAFVANGSPNRVWLNNQEADLGDGFPDTGDNCPDVPNPRQKDMNSDGEGNLCDDDTDGDTIPNSSDTDDDGDGVPDTADGGIGSVSSLDPDRDHDGIYDGIDPLPNDPSNSDQCKGQAVYIWTMSVNGDETCGVSEKITLNPSAAVESSGKLTLIAPEVLVDPSTLSIRVDGGGTLEIISEDATGGLKLD